MSLRGKTYQYEPSIRSIEQSSMVFHTKFHESLSKEGMEGLSRQFAGSFKSTNHVNVPSFHSSVVKHSHNRRISS